MIAARTDPHDPTPDEPFADLIDDLVELGYTAGDPIDGITTYAHPAGRGILTTIDEIRHRAARLRRRDDHGDPTWMIRLSADVPAAVQRIVVHTMLHANSGDEQSILRAITGTVLHEPQSAP